MKNAIKIMILLSGFLFVDEQFASAAGAKEVARTVKVRGMELWNALNNTVASGGLGIYRVGDNLVVMPDTRLRAKKVLESLDLHQQKVFKLDLEESVYGKGFTLPIDKLKIAIRASHIKTLEKWEEQVKNNLLKTIEFKPVNKQTAERFSSVR